MAVRWLLIVALSMLMTRMTMLWRSQQVPQADANALTLPEPPLPAPMGRSFLSALPLFQDQLPPRPPAFNPKVPAGSFPSRPTEPIPTSASMGNQVYQRVGPAVVTIYVGREIGSGSILTPDGLVITNHHVIRQAQVQNDTIRVRTISGQDFAGQLVATDRRFDLALVQLRGVTALPTVPLANPQTIQVGLPVWAIGSPLGQAGVMTEGTLRRVAQNGDLISDVQLQPGNSGGPLLNGQGEMIGINKGIRPSRNDSRRVTSFSTSIAMARSFISQNQPTSRVPIMAP